MNVRIMNPQEHLRMLHAIPQHPQRSNEWFAQRMGRITTSDSGTIIGTNPYQKAIEVLFKKCGAGPPFTGNVATMHGQKYESEAIDMYCRAMGKIHHEFGLIDYDSVARDEHSIRTYPNGIPWLAGSPDGVAEDALGLEDLVLLEIKCPYRRKIKLGECPEYYYSQVQLNMAILNINRADYIEYKPASGSNPLVLNIVRIQRDNRWFDEHYPILRDFWESIIYWRQRDIQDHPEYLAYHKPEPTLRNPPMFLATTSDEE